MQPEARIVEDWFGDLELTGPQEQLVLRLFEEPTNAFHHWLLRAANRMRNNGITADQAFIVLMKRAELHLSRHVPPREIRETLKKAYGACEPSSAPVVPRSEFSELSTKTKLRALMDSSDWPKHYGVEELLNDAPRYSSRLCQKSSGFLLDALFRNHRRRGEEQYLCVGRHRGPERGYHSETIPWIDGVGWIIPEWANLVVPNLANARSGRTQEGKPSNRSKNMFPDRHYLVLESDLGHGTEDVQAALIRFTGKIMKRRPVLILTSGSKSVHSWWDVRGLTETFVVGYLTEMKGLFDPAAKTRNQLFRMPNGFRDGPSGERGAKQQALWFDYEALLGGVPRGCD